MKPESGPMEGDYPWREFLRYCHELIFGVFQINQDKPIIEQILQTSIRPAVKMKRTSATAEAAGQPAPCQLSHKKK